MDFESESWDVSEEASELTSQLFTDTPVKNNKKKSKRKSLEKELLNTNKHSPNNDDGRHTAQAKTASGKGEMKKHSKKKKKGKNYEDKKSSIVSNFNTDKGPTGNEITLNINGKEKEDKQAKKRKHKNEMISNSSQKDISSFSLKLDTSYESFNESSKKNKHMKFDDGDLGGVDNKPLSQSGGRSNKKKKRKHAETDNLANSHTSVIENNSEDSRPNSVETARRQTKKNKKRKHVETDNVANNHFNIIDNDSKDSRPNSIEMMQSLQKKKKKRKLEETDNLTINHTNIIDNSKDSRPNSIDMMLSPTKKKKQPQKHEMDSLQNSKSDNELKINDRTDFDNTSEKTKSKSKDDIDLDTLQGNNLDLPLSGKKKKKKQKKRKNRDKSLPETSTEPVDSKINTLHTDQQHKNGHCEPTTSNISDSSIGKKEKKDEVKSNNFKGKQLSLDTSKQKTQEKHGKPNKMEKEESVVKTNKSLKRHSLPFTPQKIKELLAKTMQDSPNSTDKQISEKHSSSNIVKGKKKNTKPSNTNSNVSNDQEFKRGSKHQDKRKHSVDELRPKSLLEQNKERLEAARFRFINEQLYTRTGDEAFDLFKDDPEAFQVYHKGFQNQVEKWPVNPVDVIIDFVKSLPPNKVVADFGCGDAKLAQSVSNKVHSFDLVALNEHVTVCDIANVPLSDHSVDIAVFCLSLMGTNFSKYLSEANRVLKKGGTLMIAEVASRFNKVRDFLADLKKLGFRTIEQDTRNDMFVLMKFEKKSSLKKTVIKQMKLKPCVYKKR